MRLSGLSGLLFSRPGACLLLCTKHGLILGHRVHLLCLLCYKAHSLITPKSLEPRHHPGMSLLPSRSLIQHRKLTFLRCQASPLFSALVLFLIHLPMIHMLLRRVE
ncbi:hypothetical protein EJ03DRAFT_194646 [Teratosphaeria nubilosa]|uniref:Uncharacterized protein n=1 Tax=Teratosphaeria nubilosa TaxID=161662 RepID=A0A6G1KZZ2_9PEZI|nr:hypothetical protein EJ03DRAFT_194646 [Teratosphaeria nubilosa]